MYVATIDTGTTNTRVSIWRDDKVVSIGTEEVGVRDTSITGSKTKLQQGIKMALSKAIDEAGINIEEVSVIISSGMITSNVGIYEVPHSIAPVSIYDLADKMVSVRIPEITDNKDIWFVPGVKNNVKNISIDNFEEMDIMRGEEVETFGLIKRLNLKGPALFILPGSHSKFVCVDSENKITGCITTLGGELLSVLTNETILANSLDKKFAEKIDESWLLKGARYSKKIGLNRVSFSTRIIDQFTDVTQNEKANFILGAVLSTDVMALKKSSALHTLPSMSIVIAGKKILKEAFEIIIKQDNYFKGDIITVSDKDMEYLAGYGAICIAKERRLIS